MSCSSSLNTIEPIPVSPGFTLYIFDCISLVYAEKVLLTLCKVVDDRSVNNTDPARNKIESRHVSGTNYTDIVVSCLLDYGEPSGQDAVDNATNADSLYVFDELGLVSYSPSGQGRLLTHVIFHPVQKSQNRIIEIVYTVRIQLS